MLGASAAVLLPQACSHEQLGGVRYDRYLGLTHFKKGEWVGVGKQQGTAAHIGIVYLAPSGSTPAFFGRRARRFLGPQRRFHWRQALLSLCRELGPLCSPLLHSPFSCTKATQAAAGSLDNANRYIAGCAPASATRSSTTSTPRWHSRHNNSSNSSSTSTTLPHPYHCCTPAATRASDSSADTVVATSRWRYLAFESRCVDSRHKAWA